MEKAISGKTLRYDSSRSFRVIEIDSYRKPICDFLLVFHYNYKPVFYRFRDIIYLLKMCVFRRYYPLQSCFKPL